MCLCVSVCGEMCRERDKYIKYIYTDFRLNLNLEDTYTKLGVKRKSEVYKYRVIESFFSTL